MRNERRKTTGPIGSGQEARAAPRAVGHFRPRARAGAAVVARGIAGLLAAGLLAAGLAAAHHGPGAYDRSRTITVTGVVTRFEFVNPHVLIYIAADDDGATVEWSGELTSPNRLARMGGPVSWHKDLLQPGDTVTLTGNPTHNGAPALLLSRVEDGDGNVLTSSGR
jgi:hypothetical protein